MISQEINLTAYSAIGFNQSSLIAVGQDIKGNYYGCGSVRTYKTTLQYIAGDFQLMFISDMSSNKKLILYDTNL